MCFQPSERRRRARDAQKAEAPGREGESGILVRDGVKRLSEGQQPQAGEKTREKQNVGLKMARWRRSAGVQHTLLQLYIYT